MYAQLLYEILKLTLYLNSKQNMHIFDVPLNDLFILDPRHDANSILDQTKTKSMKKMDL